MKYNARLGFIGYGTIATLALEALARSRTKPLEAVVLLAKPEGAGRATSLFENCPNLAREFRVVTDIDALADADPHIVAEAAGHEAVRAYAPHLLARGIGVLVTSTGALADPRLRDAVAAAEAEGHAQMSICAGAVGGLDILAAARLSGLEDVTYISRKPPRAWRGTPAEQRVDLATLTREATFFEGTADDAATDFPQNANVAATVALSARASSDARPPDRRSDRRPQHPRGPRSLRLRRVRHPHRGPRRARQSQDVSDDRLCARRRSRGPICACVSARAPSFEWRRCGL